MLRKLRNNWRSWMAMVSAAGCSSAWVAAGLVTPQKEAELLKEVRVPDGFEASIFAAAPEVNYPVFVAAAPDGTLYVSSDKNGSLDRAPNRGRVLRVRDLDGDGHADEVKEFVRNVDSPRGLVWDHDRLYLMHPPHLSVFIDRDGDGESDEQRILVRNIAFGFKDRPADHSSNGLELGIDGWIYCAIGDFGFMEAEGADGRKLQLRGGGVVRVRPDGTGLELYSRGTRNILEVAVSPTLEMFSRDNTNDGDGWDIRLHHFTGLSEHGYPSLYKNFKGEFVEPLADYGGGSGCGAMWLSEPGFPEGYNHQPYTADWGREWVYRHPLEPAGASFKAGQEEFVRATRVTDLDVDASSRVYVASWKGATFTYAGENVGYVVRVTPKGYQAEPLPDFENATTPQLLALLDSPSRRRRRESQRALLRRELSSADLRAIEHIAANDDSALETRVAAIFLLKQEQGRGAHPFLAELAKDKTVRQFCIRALADRLEEIDGVPVAPILAGLKDADPRVRRESAYALARLGDRAHAQAMAPLLGDPDPRVAHTAMQALKRLEAIEACLAVVDDPAAPTTRRIGALRVLQALHQPAVVAALLHRLEQEQDSGRRRGLITALARLHQMEGIWKGDSWGTRPDTSGPYYQPVAWSESKKIEAALERVLAGAQGEEAAFVIAELGRHKVQNQPLLSRIVQLAGADAALRAPALAQLARAGNLPSGAEELARAAAVDPESDAQERAHAVIALSRLENEAAARTLLNAMPLFEESRRDSAAQRARQAFTRARAWETHLALLQTEAARLDQTISPWADAALLALSDRRGVPDEIKQAAQRALEQAWQDSRRCIQLLDAVRLVEHRRARDKVVQLALFSSNSAVVEAARRTARALRFEKEIEAALEQSKEPLIADLEVAGVSSAVLSMKGDVKLGEELFARQTCVNCHTVRADEPLRGPFLGNIAATYQRADLADAILLPNKSIAQGFVANYFLLKDGAEHEGFVVREAADLVVIRNVAAQEIEIPASEIAARRKLEKSLMPEGLAANLTVKELASLLDYLESLAKDNQ